MIRTSDFALYTIACSFKMSFVPFFNRGFVWFAIDDWSFMSMVPEQELCNLVLTSNVFFISRKQRQPPEVSCKKRGYYEIKNKCRQTIDRFRLNNSQVINGTILIFTFRKNDVVRRTFSSFWDFCCCYHQIIAISILISEGRDKKRGFLETNSSEYSFSKSKMQGIFKPCFVSKIRPRTISIKWDGGGGVVNCILSDGFRRTCRIDAIKKHQYKLWIESHNNIFEIEY